MIQNIDRTVFGVYIRCIELSQQYLERNIFQKIYKQIMEKVVRSARYQYCKFWIRDLLDLCRF